MTPEERKAYMKEYRKSEEYKAKEKERQKKIYEERKASGEEASRQKKYIAQRKEERHEKHMENVVKAYNNEARGYGGSRKAFDKMNKYRNPESEVFMEGYWPMRQTSTLVKKLEL